MDLLKCHRSLLCSGRAGQTKGGRTWEGGGEGGVAEGDDDDDEDEEEEEIKRWLSFF